MAKLKRYSIKQVINGVTYFNLSFTTTEKHYKKLLSVLYLPKKNEFVTKDNNLYFHRGHFRIRDIDRSSSSYGEYFYHKPYLKIISPLSYNKFVENIKGIIFDNFVIVGFKLGLSGDFREVPNIIIQGKEFEYYVSNYFKKQGYKIINNFEKEENDEGIDIIAIRDDELLLIQCKNWEVSIISHKEIKEFLGNCYMFLYKHKEYRKFKKVRRIYVSSNPNLDNSVKYLLKDYYPFVEYLHIPFKK